MNIPRKWRVGRGVRALVAAAFCAAACAAGAQEVDYERVAGGYIGDGGPALQASMYGVLDIAFDANGYGYASQPRESRIRRISPDGSLVTTLIGDGIPGFSGDGGPASAARVSRPFGLAVDAAGNIYFADLGNNRVRRISTTGVVTTVAGDGSNTMSGDGGPATAAGIPGPYALEFDAAGNLYISDWEAHVIRKVAPNGTISTFAGNGVAGFSGDGGPATQASLNLPEGMSFDAAGNLYVADAINNRVRMITPGGTISTVAGNGSTTSTGDGGPATQAGIFYPYNVLIDPEGGLLVTDSNCRIRRVVAGVITTAAGDGSCFPSGDGGPAVQAGFGAPEGMAFDAEGMFYFVDAEFGYIRQVDTDTMTISTVAGIGGFRGEGAPATEALFTYTRSVAAGPGGTLAVADYYNQMIRLIDGAGIIRTLAADLGTVRDLAFDRAGNVYAARGPRILKIDQAGTTSVLEDGSFPQGLAVDAGGNIYFSSGNQVFRRSPGGAFSIVAGLEESGFGGDGGPATAARLDRPTGIAVHADGSVYILDYGNLRIRKIGPDGVISTIAGTGNPGPSGTGGLATNAALGELWGLAVDRNGIVYIAEGESVRRITPDGRIHALSGWSGFAHDVAVDDAGRVHIATGGATIVRATVLPPIASDFDLDAGATSDVYWRNQGTGESVIWRSANSRLPIRVTRVTSLAWQVEALGDFDGDGKSDVFWRNRNTGENVIWNGAISSRSRLVPAVSPVWQLAAAADFDGDDVDDVMWRNTRTGANLVWRSADSATPMAVMGVTNLSWKVVGAGDFDGDGREDLLWRDGQRGKNVIWRGADGLDPQSMVGVTDLAWQVAGVGDFNADGRADVLWRQEDRGTNVIWRSGNAATQQDVTDVTNPAWVVAGVGDYNGDGRSDILWRHGTTGANVIWRSASSSQQQAVSGVTNTEWTVID